LSEPALQGALGRWLVAGRQSQEQADEAGAPARVLAAQTNGPVPDPLGGAGARARAAAVGGDEAALAQPAAAGDQVLDRADG
jgi:hypothetical protein